MENKHTPGPWTVGDTPAIVYDDNACEVAMATFNQESFEANARLIAAAPELLAALEFIVNDAEPGEDARLTANGYNRACAAIAKAT